MLREEVEVCSYCMGENVLQWDVEKDGYKAKCQHCGEEMMLCDACFYSDDNESHYCDWTEEGCWRSRTADVVVFRDTTDMDDKKDDNNLVIIRTFEWCIRDYVDKVHNVNYKVWIDTYTADIAQDLFDFLIKNDYKYEILEF